MISNKKKLYLFSVIFFVFVIGSFEVKVNAEYVLDSTSLVDDIEYVSNEIEELSSFSTEYSNLILEFQNSDMVADVQNGFISTINNLKDAYYSFNNAINEAIDYTKASALVYSALIVFQIYDFPLAKELLLKSWEGYKGVYTPYYGYVMNDNPVINDIVHHNRTSGVFSFNGNYSPYKNGNDLFFAINKFDCTVSGTSVYVSDVYDFETSYSQYKELFNKILSQFGRIMAAGYLSEYTISYKATHNTSYVYSDINDVYHNKTCVCGYSVDEKHTWSKFTNSLIEPMYDPNMKICRKCGRIKYEGLEF